MSEFITYSLIATICFAFVGYIFTHRKKQEGEETTSKNHRLIALLMWIVVGSLIAYNEFGDSL